LGVTTTVKEIARHAGVAPVLAEAARAAGEMSGFDPPTIANEDKLLAVMRQRRYGEEAAIAGEVHDALQEQCC
jgi:hypothetical protein